MLRSAAAPRSRSSRSASRNKGCFPTNPAAHDRAVSDGCPIRPAHSASASSTPAQPAARTPATATSRFGAVVTPGSASAARTGFTRSRRPTDGST